MKPLQQILDEKAKEKEVWKTIRGYNRRYTISSWGRVKTNGRGKEIIMKQNKDKKGYFIIGFWKGREHFTHKVHRLVGRYFIPNPKRKPQINHIDCDRINNYYKNLEWCTHQENMNHANKKGLIRRICGEEHPSSKLTTTQVLEIRASKLHPLKLSDIYGVTESAIYGIVTRKNWKHLA